VVENFLMTSYVSDVFISVAEPSPDTVCRMFYGMVTKSVMLHAAENYVH